MRQPESRFRIGRAFERAILKGWLYAKAMKLHTDPPPMIGDVASHEKAFHIAAAILETMADEIAVEK